MASLILNKYLFKFCEFFFSVESDRIDPCKIIINNIMYYNFNCIITHIGWNQNEFLFCLFY